MVELELPSAPVVGLGPSVVEPPSPLNMLYTIPPRPGVDEVLEVELVDTAKVLIAMAVSLVADEMTGASVVLSPFGDIVWRVIATSDIGAIVNDDESKAMFDVI